MNNKIYSLFQHLSNSLTAFIDSAPVNDEEKIRLQHYTIFLSIGIPTMAVFGAINLLRGNFLLCVLILCSGIGLFIGLLLLRSLKNGRIIYRINALLFGSLVIYMMVIGGESGSKILWMYTFPLISFFLFGKKEGLFWSGFLLFITLLVFWNPLQGNLIFNYGLEFQTRFLTTYIIVSTITYWFEKYRFQYKHGMEEKNRILEEEKERLEYEIKERKRLENELRLLASTDPLTGAANHRHFMEIADKEYDRFKRYSHRLAFAMMDIDHFKRVNDTYGHPTGDEVLKGLVQHCNLHLRKSDYMGRLGGEEFGLLLIETTPPDAKLVVERLRKKLAEFSLPVHDGNLQVTVSIGVTKVLKDDTSFEQAMKRADNALYRAKSAGRNRVEFL